MFLLLTYYLLCDRSTFPSTTTYSSSSYIVDLTTYLHALWYSPLQIALALFFLWQQLGASSLGGVLVILIMIPVTKSIAQWMGGMQKKLMIAKDARVELNSEVLAGMKVIKLQAWEESFQKRILDLREVELRNLLRYFVGVSFLLLANSGHCTKILYLFLFSSHRIITFSIMK